jgi:diketogulonate reductase-like aldo/keto reductase
MIKEAVELSENPIANNQVEYHFLLDQNKLIEECNKHGISLTAYSPLAQGKLLSNETLLSIAKRLEKEPAQVALRWLYQQENVIAIPKTAHRERAKSNLETLDFKLSQEDMNELSGLQSTEGRFINPEGLSPEWDK